MTNPSDIEDIIPPSLEEYFFDDPHDDTPDDRRADMSDDSDTHDLQSITGLRRLIPNFLTLCGMAAGLVAIQKAILGEWEHAVLLIFVAAVIDAMDGAIARLLKATSRFGAELDSLADFLSFGVAPAFILYLWALSDAGALGWMASLVFAMACALRLARFNTMSLSDFDPRPAWSRKFFMGVPAPGAAGLVLMPIILSQAIPETRMLDFLNPLIGIWMIIVASLMVSRLPTLSSKQIKLPKGTPIIPLLAMAVVFIAAMVHTPWTTLAVITVMYLLSLPLGVQIYRRMKKANSQKSANQASKAA